MPGIVGKRTATDSDPKAIPDARHIKRQRVENSLERNSPRPSTAMEEITSPRQLQKALSFEQGAASSFRTSLNMLKAFLDSILYPTEDRDNLPRKRAILLEYLVSQNKPTTEDKEGAFLPHFFQAWEFAAETNFDGLLSQIVANLALLLKVFASHADFSEYGALLCKGVLQNSIAKRLNRTLNAPASKENIISPTLRLLTEITRFNEGAHAKSVYAKRDFTMDPKILGRNIGLWKESTGDAEADKRKPSIRINAVRYLLAHLVYQDELAKTEILSNTNVVRAVFDHLNVDPPHMIFEILNVFKDHVFLDKTIMRYTKSRILTGRTLTHIASLYRYETVAESLPEGRKGPDELAHEFLCLVCTSPAYGVMLPSYGYYPPANEEDDGDAVVEDAEYTNNITVDPAESPDATSRIRNIILSEFVLSLRPYANVLQQELVLAIFKACPELVATYFRQKETFNYDPKLTSTWIGYSSFLYQTIELPVPHNLGGRRAYREFPPAVSTVIQSILPQPLTQAILTKCLNSSSDLVNLFSIRVLIVAFHKLRALLAEYNTAASIRSSKPWEQGAQRLVAEFCQRCPLMKTVTVASKRPAFQKDMMRESITRLLRLYFEVTPQVALQEKFDVSIPLCNALIQAGTPSEAPEDKALRVMELEHWIQIARHSPSTRWWQKNKILPHSPFATLLKLVVTSTTGDLYNGIKTLLGDMLKDYGMLQMTTQPDALDSLLASLAPSNGAAGPPQEVLEFLDDCCARFVKGPIKYFDDLDAIRPKDQPEGLETGPFSPLLMTLVEQWPFKGSKPEKGNPAEPLAQWISKLLYLLKLIGEDEPLLEAVRDSLASSADEAYKKILEDCFLWKMSKEKAKEALKLATGADFSGSERSSASPRPTLQQQQAKDVEMPKDGPMGIDLELPPHEDEKHPGLNRWKRNDMEESIDNGAIGELLLCLCSKHQEIRLQAVANIRQFMAKIDATPDNNDLLQLKLLLGEALETARPTVDTEPLPYVGGVFASRAVAVLADPTHFMFGKLNTFLMKRPSWTVANLPRYFGRAIINSEPEHDGAYHKEVDWFLDFLLDALREDTDMEIYRTKNVFERLLTYYASASCAMAAKEKIVRILMRAAAVGGSTTLITRCGIVSWIQMRLESNDHRHRLLRRLAGRVWETCDQEKVCSWSSGAAEKAIEAIAQAA